MKYLKKILPMVGLEPTTTRLKAGRSKPTELHGQNEEVFLYYCDNLSLNKFKNK